MIDRKKPHRHRPWYRRISRRRALPIALIAVACLLLLGVYRQLGKAPAPSAREYPEAFHRAN